MSLSFNGWYGSIGSGNGLAPNMQQAIIWSNVCCTDTYMRRSCLLSSICHCMPSVRIVINPDAGLKQHMRVLLEMELTFHKMATSIDNNQWRKDLEIQLTNWYPSPNGT